MHSLWFVQWDFTKRDHPRNLGRVSGSGPVIYGKESKVNVYRNEISIQLFYTLYLNRKEKNAK